MVTEVKHLAMETLEGGLDEIRRSPADRGVLELIVRRPQTEEREREVLETGNAAGVPARRMGRRIRICSSIS